MENEVPEDPGYTPSVKNEVDDEDQLELFEYEIEQSVAGLLMNSLFVTMCILIAVAVIKKKV